MSFLSSMKSYLAEVKNTDFSYYMEENSKRVFMAILVSALWYMSIIAQYHMILLPSRPQTKAWEYINHIKQKDYEKASECFINVPEGPLTGKEYIKNALETKYDNTSDITVKEVLAEAPLDTVDILLSIKNSDSTVSEDRISLYCTKKTMGGLKKDWGIIFPFKTGSISVKGINGGLVFVDGIEAGVIKGGSFDAGNIISGSHEFKVVAQNVAVSDLISEQVTGSTNVLEIKVKLDDNFKKNMDNLITNFCRGWSNYCLTQNAESIKPYLTDKLYKRYTSETDRFSGSKYTISEFTVEHLDLSLGDVQSTYYMVNEQWHIKEVITDTTLLFKDNGKRELEQYQYAKWKYHIVNDGGTWKIDSAEQLSYKQEIK